MSLERDLARLITSSHSFTWAQFERVRRDAVRLGLSQAKAAAWKTPGEPAFVSNLLEYPFDKYRLSRTIEEHLKPQGLSATTPLVSGVFIHQKPKVKLRGLPGHIELGDLLFVRHHFQSGVAEPQGRAFLLQAKSASSPNTGVLRGKEAQQFALYSDWTTEFFFPHKEIGDPPGGAKRWNLSIGPSKYADSGLYGIVANTVAVPATFHSGCPWSVGRAMPPSGGASPSVSAPRSLASMFEAFLLGTEGRPWDFHPTKTDHWSSFIKECLKSASGWRPYPVMRVGATGAATRPRRRDITSFLAAMAELQSEGWWGVEPFFEFQFESAKQIGARWLGSLPSETDVEGEGGGDGGKVAGEDSTAVAVPSRGMSVLYMATMGDAPLGGEPEGPMEPLPLFDTN